MASTDNPDDKVLKFPSHKVRQPGRAVNDTPLHRLLIVVNDLTLQERFDFVIENLFKEPTDDAEGAAIAAQLNIALFGGWLLADLLIPAATEFPDIHAMFPMTLELIEDARQNMIEMERRRGILPTTFDN